MYTIVTYGVLASVKLLYCVFNGCCFIYRDRVPFVLTSDMVYVLEMGMPQNRGFQLFVEYSCEAFNILRQNANLFITLLSLVCSIFKMIVFKR